jgi:hypothetical protein
MALFWAFALHSVLSYCNAAVTVIPLTLNLPRRYESNETPVISDSDLLTRLHTGTTLDTWPLLSSNAMERIRDIPLEGIYPSQDSFLRGVIDTGANHQHLVFQPQDIWLTILKQLSSYLRNHKDDTEIFGVWDNLDGKITPSPMAAMFLGNSMDTWTKKQFDLRSKASWLADWVRPNFKTASNPDQPLILVNSSARMLANTLMMASSSSTLEELPAFPCAN